MSIYLGTRRPSSSGGGGSGFEPSSANIIYVSDPSHLTSISSDKIYILTTTVDMGTQSIEVPEGGITIEGFGTNLSSIISSEDNYQLFTSPITGSGGINLRQFTISVTGVSSQVFHITGATGNEGFDFVEMNYVNCTSRGEFSNWRQGYEDILAMFGGTPSLTLTGTWTGGYVTRNALIRNLDSGMTDSLFIKGTGLTLASRFLSVVNCDLPALASYCDFDSTVFSEPSLVIVEGSVFTREGVIQSGDSNFFPNLDPEDLVCAWKNSNNGIRETVEGGYTEITTEATTTITTSSVYYDISGTFTPSSLSHFSSPTGGVLQHDGNSPTQFKLDAGLVIDGNANDVIGVKVIKWSEVDQEWQDLYVQRSQITSIIGGRDVATVVINRLVTLEKGDRVKLQVANLTDIANVVVELDSYIQVLRA